MPSKRCSCLVAIVCLGLWAGPGGAADFSDPTWPCIQRKVENLSLGLMWPTPVDTAVLDTDDALQRDVNDLGDRLALRRVALEDLQPQAEAFAAKYNGREEALGLAFERVFGSLSKRRVQIIGGIGDFSLSQIALAEQIDVKRAEMDALLAADSPDFDRIDTLEEQIDWDQVIHSDRQRTITYLCETPQIIERRLFAIARMLQQLAEDDG